MLPLGLTDRDGSQSTTSSSCVVFEYMYVLKLCCRSAPFEIYYAFLIKLSLSSYFSKLLYYFLKSALFKINVGWKCF